MNLLGCDINKRVRKFEMPEFDNNIKEKKGPGLFKIILWTLLAFIIGSAINGIKNDYKKLNNK